MSVNKESTTVTNTANKASGYSEGLDMAVYNPSEISYEGGNTDRGDTAIGFISNLYGAKGTNKGTSIKADQFTTTVASAPWSLANKYALFAYNGFNGNSMAIAKEDYLDTYDNSLMGGEYAKTPSIAKLVDYFHDLPVKYDYSDFMWCKYAGYMPNNYLLTLRRFATPVEDNIFSRIINQTTADESAAFDTWNTDAAKWIGDAEKGETRSLDKYEKKHKKPPAPLGEHRVDVKPDISRAVTWMGEDTGNNLTELLSFTYGQKWKTQSSETNTQEVGSDQSYTSQPFYSRMGNGGIGGMMKAGVDTLSGTTASKKYSASHAQGFDPYETTYPNFVVGPVNVINEMQTRDVGLSFDQDIKVVFEYDLKSYGGVNPKVALLDIIANLLVLTYDNANFWGGANRFYGGSGYVAPRFGNTEELRKGNFKGFLSSLVGDIGGGFSNAFAGAGGEFSIGSILGGLGSVSGTLFGNFLGNMIDKQVGAPPAMMHLKGMITGESTGNWHLTVGNPLNPIALIGNLILENSNLSFSGPLGNDDFPSGIKLECTLKHARPRDKTDFESMFNAGKGRLYAAAYGEEDVLNLIGEDVRVYGAFQKGASEAKTSKYDAWDGLPGSQIAKSHSLSSQSISDLKHAVAMNEFSVVM